MIYELKSIEQLLDFIASVSRSRAGYIFRGIAKQRYSLTTSIERTYSPRDLATKGYHIEERVKLAQFAQIAHQYIRDVSVDTNSIIEVWSLMQHYGARTRLLDFTRSLPVALYFALWERNGLEKPTVWCISGEKVETELKRRIDEIREESRNVRLQSIKDISIPGEWKTEEFIRDPKKDEILNILLHSSLRERFSLSPEIPDLVIPVDAPRFNQRMLMQAGTFLMPLNTKSSFLTNLQGLFSPVNDRTASEDGDRKEPTVESFVEELDRQATIVLDIGGIKLGHLTHLLEALNVRGETLFPDFPGLMQTLAMPMWLPENQR